MLAAPVDPQFSVHQQRTRRSLIDAHSFVQLLDIARNSEVLRNHNFAQRTLKTNLVRHHDQQLKEEEGEQEEGLSSKNDQSGIYRTAMLTEPESKTKGRKGETQGSKQHRYELPSEM